MSDMKLVIVLRRDLEMSAGKVGVQSGHAVMGSYFDSMDRWGTIACDMIDPWRGEGKKKVCLGVDSEEELLALLKQCEEKNIGHYLVRDAGRTEVLPGTPTTLGIGPDVSSHIDKVTGELGLY